jgi:sialate O-acetylesterase
MKFRRIIFLLTICFSLLLLSQNAFAQVRLPRLISDGMVLQRDTDLKIWGWADAHEEISLSFLNKTYYTKADEKGEWVILLPELAAGGPYYMEINARNNIIINDIMVGDVWVCSGQSNMELPMERVQDRYPEEISSCNYPEIRQFLVPDRYDFNTIQNDFEAGSWEPANPETVLRFTTVGYFFAKTLHEKYDVPIGLINASLGGSPAEAWLSEDALKAFPKHLETANRFKDNDYINQIIEKDKAMSDAWYNRIRELDAGYADGEKPWFDPAYDASSWSSMPIPSFWEDQGLGPVNGVVWFRKKIEVPATMVGKPARLLMGRAVDADSTYINGVLVGTVSYQYPPRRYDIPNNVLKEGDNTIVVRVINNRGSGGFIKDKPYQLSAGGKTIDLKGEWQYKLGAVMDPLPQQTFIRWKPLGLYNGMIAPLLNQKIKGVIWYQGESNTKDPAEYHELFSAVINNWRKKWNQGDFPFLYVQLANYMQVKSQPSESNWAELREAQLQTLSVPNTAMAVIIDIGEWNDIHPLNKEDVGKRLALAAQNIAYGDNEVVYSGPVYDSMKIEGSTIVLSFNNIGSGLEAKGGELNQFAIAGADKKFVWARAKITDNKVIVWNDTISAPLAVRYAWADNPKGANLYNKEGLPASPFRTDED